MKQITFLTLFLSFCQIYAIPKKYSLQELKGKKLVPYIPKGTKNKELVVFWASWCPECHDKLSHAVPKMTKRADLQVVSVNMDEEIAPVIRYVKKEHITFPVLQNSDEALIKDLKVTGVPHWAVYKRSSEDEDWSLVDHAPAFDVERVEAALGSR